MSKTFGGENKFDKSLVRCLPLLVVFELFLNQLFLFVVWVVKQMAAQAQNEEKFTHSEQVAMDVIKNTHEGGNDEVKKIIVDRVETYVVLNKPGANGTLRDKLLNIRNYSKVMNVSMLQKEINNELVEYHTILSKAKFIRKKKENPIPPIPIQGSRLEQRLAEMVNKQSQYFNAVTNLKCLYIDSNEDGQKAMLVDLLQILNEQPLDFFDIIKILKDINYDLPGLFDKMTKKYGKKE